MFHSIRPNYEKSARLFLPLGVIFLKMVNMTDQKFEIIFKPSKKIADNGFWVADQESAVRFLKFKVDN